MARNESATARREPARAAQPLPPGPEAATENQRAMAYARQRAQAEAQQPADPIVPDDRTGSTQEEADLMNEAFDALGGTREARDKVLRTWSRGMSRDSLFQAVGVESGPAPEGTELVRSNTTGGLARTDVKYPQKGAILFAGVDAKEGEIQTGLPAGETEPGLQGQATLEQGRNHLAPPDNDSAERNAPPPAMELRRARGDGSELARRGPGRPSNAERATRAKTESEAKAAEKSKSDQ